MVSKRKIEKSSIGVLEIILYVVSAALCLLALVGSAVALSTISDIKIFDHFLDSITKDSDDADRRRRYRDVAWWLLSVGIAGIVLPFVMAVIRKLYFDNVFTDNFLIFAIISAMFSSVLAIAIIAGGGASISNAKNVQHKYLDRLDCPAIEGIPSDQYPGGYEYLHRNQTLCDNLEKLKKCQFASAGVSFLGGGTFGILVVIAVVNFMKKKRQSDYQRINSCN